MRDVAAHGGGYRYAFMRQNQILFLRYADD